MGKYDLQPRGPKTLHLQELPQGATEALSLENLTNAKSEAGRVNPGQAETETRCYATGWIRTQVTVVFQNVFPALQNHLFNDKQCFSSPQGDPLFF